MARPTARNLLPGPPQVVRVLDDCWPEIVLALPGPALDAWAATCRDLAASGLAPELIVRYIRGTASLSRLGGREAPLALAPVVRDLARFAGTPTALRLLDLAAAPPKALARSGAFVHWLGLVRLVGARAPKAAGLFLDRADTLLATLDGQALEAWVLAGLRRAAGDPAKQVAIFGLNDGEGLAALERPKDALYFAEVERALRAYLMILWRFSPALRAVPAAANMRRTGFAGGVVRIPDRYAGYRGAEAEALFRAALAHIAAHLHFGRKKFAEGRLKPVQIALVSLIEDARVEALCLRALPGLKRLWLPFHTAQPEGLVTAASLMARLARALIDPDYVDDNGWVRKGRAQFQAAKADWQDPEISRRIGGLLGNDLGQMRLQFNARTHVVEPVYRDDNLGLWDFTTPPKTTESDDLVESVRVERSDSPTAPPDREREEAGAEVDARPVSLVPPEPGTGVPVARYAEWDYLVHRERPDWTTLVEYRAEEGAAEAIDAILRRHPGVTARIDRLVRLARISRPAWRRRQPEGEGLDLDACIAATIDRRIGSRADPMIHQRRERRARDLSVLVLLDVSQSTNDLVRAAGASVLSVEREAASLLAHAMDSLGDAFAIHAFCSDGRADVRYLRVKDFDGAFDVGAKRRLAGLSGRLSTRMGAALRHACVELGRQRAYRRLLMVVTDGEPSDTDVADPRYLIEDARRAVTLLRQSGTDVLCVGLDAGKDRDLARIFGQRNLVLIDRIERLPERLPMLYMRVAS